MGAIGGLLGTAGGTNGTGINTMQAPALQNSINPQQMQQSYDNTQMGLNNQNELMKALRDAGGIQNQSNVYGQMQNIAAGKGPNPAQAMLAQQTGQNVANQAALMAGQRGAGANAGLMARQAAQQGGALQQNAIGQGATMQANQSLNALGQAGNIAGQQVGNQMNATNAYTQNALGQQGQLLGNQQAMNQNAVGINNANASMANTQMQGQQAMIGGLLQGGASAAKMGMAGGGEVHNYAQGGQTNYAQGGQTSGPQSAFGQFLKGASSGMPTAPQSQLNTGGQQMGQAIGQGIGNLFASSSQPQGGGGLTSPKMMKQGGRVDYSPGGHVQAQDQDQKAVAPGNSYNNDKIPALLSEHEIVIPRDVTQSADPVQASAKFVASVLAKRKVGK